MAAYRVEHAASSPKSFVEPFRAPTTLFADHILVDITKANERDRLPAVARCDKVNPI